MPSPVGHALAGAAVALAAQRAAAIELRPRVLLGLSALLAALPDLDLLYQPIHRALTHSVGAVIAVLIITIIASRVTARVTRRGAIVIGLVCAVAWGSHIVLDWMGADPNVPRGIKALWPFSDRWFISDWDIFLGTERRHPFTVESMLQNLRAVTREILLLAPLVIVLLLTRSTRREGRAIAADGSAQRNQA